jgi:hypothetical protein
MKDVSEGNDVEELLKKLRVIDVAFDYENLMFRQLILTSALERWIVVRIEIVQTKNAVAAFLQC